MRCPHNCGNGKAHCDRSQPASPRSRFPAQEKQPECGQQQDDQFEGSFRPEQRNHEKNSEQRAAQAAQRICGVEVTGEIGVLIPFQLRTGQEPGINQTQERRRRYNQDARNVEFETLGKVKGILEDGRRSDGEEARYAIP